QPLRRWTRDAVGGRADAEELVPVDAREVRRTRRAQVAGPGRKRAEDLIEEPRVVAIAHVRAHLDAAGGIADGNQRNGPFDTRDHSGSGGCTAAVSHPGDVAFVDRGLDAEGIGATRQSSGASAGRASEEFPRAAS